MSYKTKQEAIDAALTGFPETEDFGCDHDLKYITGIFYECEKCHNIFEEKFKGIMVQVEKA